MDIDPRSVNTARAMEIEPQAETDGIFAARPLPRSRAWLALIFLGAGLLSVGGVIEFATGSPMTTGQGAASYFTMLFAFHAAAFLGAALIGAFPALAKPAVKALWLVAVLAAYCGAFAMWRSHPDAESLAQWLERSPAYLPAVAPLLTGVLWRRGTLADPAPPAPDAAAG